MGRAGDSLWKRHRRGEFDQQTATQLLRDFSRLPIEFHAAARWTEVALELAIRHGVTVHDGLYLALAAGTGCRVITANRRLQEACGAGVIRDVVGWVGEIR